MLTSVEFFNLQRTFWDPLFLNIFNPTNGYIVKSIEGLDPVKSDLYSTRFANLNGARYRGGRRDVRNIRFLIELKHKTISVEDLRKKLYETFMPQTKIRMHFGRDSEPSILQIDGVVETCEAALFTKEPSVVVSVICYDPDFIPSGSSINRVKTSTAFEWDALEEEVYTGSVPVGAILRLTAPEAYTGQIKFSIYPAYIGPEQSLQLDVELDTLDVIEINTIKGQRSIKFIDYSTGLTHSLMKGLIGTDWPEFGPGVNVYGLYTPGENYEYSVEWIPRFGGL